MKQQAPEHIAIIMDGNGRWAKKRRLPKIAGHRRGVAAVERTINAALEFGVKILTLYAFSTENWKRPKHEVDALMKLFERHLDRYNKKDLMKKGVRFRAIGEIEALSDSIRSKIKRIEEDTKENRNLLVNLALNYGSRREITEAAKKIADAVANKKLDISDITEDVFAGYLYTAGLPDPDILVRTSGEERVSNFLLWQIAYSEFYVTDKLWPDFDRKELRKAIDECRKRDRRYGG